MIEVTLSARELTPPALPTSLRRPRYSSIVGRVVGATFGVMFAVLHSGHPQS